MLIERAMGEVSDNERAALEAAKRASVAQLLLKCARVLNEQAIARLRSQGGLPDLRPAHTSLLPHIDLEGTRITEIARRMGISKQAVAQLVDELEAMGGLERVPDPADGRAKLVRFSHRGGRLSLLDGLAHLRALEAELVTLLGSRHVDALRRGLVALHDLLESGALTGGSDRDVKRDRPHATDAATHTGSARTTGTRRGARQRRG